MIADFGSASQNPRRLLRFLLNVVVLLLVFEGLGRRIVGGGTAGRFIFFLKDGLVLLMIPLLLRCRLPAFSAPLASALRTLAVLFVPLVFLTAVHDPVLAAFGAKQYLLFPVVALAIMAGYSDHTHVAILKHLQRLALLILPTGLMALYQLTIPPDHWLNLTPERTSMEDFSAGGRLRVSSTFPFVAQFTMFLNCAVYFCAGALSQIKEGASRWLRWGMWSLAPLLILATFATASRGAVVGGFLIFALATALAVAKRGAEEVGKLLVIGLTLMVLIVGLSIRFPEYFEGYTARKSGAEFASHETEVVDRVYGMLFGWFQPSEPVAMLLGNGLGTMSNGVEAFSRYAAAVKRVKGWGEVDLANSYLEGGIYLVVIWQGFRIALLWTAIRAYFESTSEEMVLPLTFILGYAIVTGVSGQLGIQPPLSIWWWMSIGFFFVLTKGPAGPMEEVIRETEAVDSKFRIRGRSALAERLHSRVKRNEGDEI